MAMNLANLTLGISDAFIAGGAVASPALVALSAGIAKAIIDEIHAADVDPTGGDPPMSNGAGPVAGEGKVR